MPHGAERGNGAQAVRVACCPGPSVPAKQDVPPHTTFSSHSVEGGHDRTAALLLGCQHRPGLLSEEASVHPMKEAPGLPRVVGKVLLRPTLCLRGRARAPRGISRMEQWLLSTFHWPL